MLIKFIYLIFVFYVERLKRINPVTGVQSFSVLFWLTLSKFHHRSCSAPGFETLQILSLSRRPRALYILNVGTHLHHHKFLTNQHQLQLSRITLHRSPVFTPTYGQEGGSSPPRLLQGDTSRVKLVFRFLDNDRIPGETDVSCGDCHKK